MKKSKTKLILYFITAIILICTFCIITFQKNNTQYLKIAEAEKESDNSKIGETIYISNKKELEKFRDDVNSGLHKTANVYLTNNISFSTTDWIPINNFQGTFDGCGHYISGLVVDIFDVDNCPSGFFGSTKNATIKNLGIKQSQIRVNTDNGGAGAIVGEATDTVIEKCYNDQTTIYGRESAGGIVGIIKGNSKVSQCYNKGTISLENGDSIDGAGGIVGEDSGTGIIEYCYNTNEVTGIKSAGIIGNSNSSTKISNCYNVGTIRISSPDSQSVNGAISTSQDDQKTNCYFLEGKGTALGATSQHDSDMKSEKFINILGGKDFWKYEENNYPKLKWEVTNNIYISSKSELDNWITSVNNNTEGYSSANVYLTSDINYEDSKYTPINDFTGIFNGCGNTISNIDIKLYEDLGIFKKTTGATIINLGVTNSRFIGHDKVGSIVGAAISTTIENCFSSNCNITGDSEAGGIAGQAITNSIIRKCYNNSTITVSGGGTQGGIVGNGLRSTIEYCYNTGTVNGNDEAGGICGLSGTIKYCYNVGDVTADGKQEAIGNDSTNINCYYLNGKGTGTNATSRDSNNMKQEQFINDLGGNKIWGFDAIQDYEYPVLKWQKDEVKPTIEISRLNSENSSITVTVKDRFSGVSEERAFTLYKKTGNGEEYTKQKDYPNNSVISEEGLYYVIGYDEAGNETERKEFCIDQTPPDKAKVKLNGKTVENTTEDSPAYYSEDVTVTPEGGEDALSGTRLKNVRVELDGGDGWDDLEEEDTESIDVTHEGLYRARINCYDQAGNESQSDYVYFFIDKTAPTNTKPKVTVEENSITIENNQIDTGSGIKTVEYAIRKKEEGESWSKWQTTNKFENLEGGATYEVKTRATDNVEHVTESEIETIDIEVEDSEEEYFRINNYIQDGNYIKKILPETKYKDFNINIETNMEYVVKENDKEITEEDIVKTGDILTVTSKKTGNTTTYQLVVIGDLNKDGEVTITDAQILKSYRIELIEDLEEIQKKAADVNFNEQEELTDLQIIVEYILEMITELI